MQPLLSLAFGSFHFTRRNTAFFIKANSEYTNFFFNWKIYKVLKSSYRLIPSISIVCGERHLDERMFDSSFFVKIAIHS